MIEITPSLHIRNEDLEFRYKRASGPGGQHVNRTDSAVELRFDVEHCVALDVALRSRLRQIARGRISREGILVIHAQRFRSQERNREDAVARLVELLRTAGERPTARVATRPTRASRERRLAGKKALGQRKSTRGRFRGPTD
jgi:ribosome-associated protein